MNDRELFHQRFQKHARSVQFFFINKGFSQEDAEELCQEVFFRVFKFGEDIRDDQKFSGWLKTITINTWKNKIRDLHAAKREGKEVSLDAPYRGDARTLGIHSESSALEEIHKEELRALLRQAMKQLSQTVYACVVLRIDYNMSYGDIARVLNISPAKVKSRLYQAQKKLKEILGDKVKLNSLENLNAK